MNAPRIYISREMEAQLTPEELRRFVRQKLEERTWLIRKQKPQLKKP